MQQVIQLREFSCCPHEGLQRSCSERSLSFREGTSHRHHYERGRRNICGLTFAYRAGTSIFACEIERDHKIIVCRFAVLEKWFPAGKFLRLYWECGVCAEQKAAVRRGIRQGCVVTTAAMG